MNITFTGKKSCLFFCAALACYGAMAQDNHFYSEVGIGANVVDVNRVPFWLRADKFGSVPLPGTSGSVYGSVHKNYDTVNRPLIDWGVSLEGRLNLGQKVQGILTEGYVKMAISEFEIKAGRVKEIMGLMDSTLSTGSFAMSGNALGIPKIEISVPQYYEIPILNHALAVKGNFAFGWLGQQPLQFNYTGNINMSFHQSSLYGRLGQQDWRVHVFAGINHQVYFGNGKITYGSYYNLSDWQTLVYAATGKTWRYSKIGNHLGSIDMALQYDLNHASLYLYHQFFYDEGALYHLANLRDGLTGLSLTNLEDGSGVVKWHKVLLELFSSKDQAGYPWSIHTPSGDENYYNNHNFAQGYSYKLVGVGNPLISTEKETRPFPNNSSDYFNNNRVIAMHVGAEGSVLDWRVVVKATYSKNYGTFGTSPYGNSTGNIRTRPTALFPEANQFSTYLEVGRDLPGNLSVDLSLALDRGSLLYNSGGASLRLLKRL